jgi:pimeloyl-ACP methyl ester carboxylesterase
LAVLALFAIALSCATVLLLPQAEGEDNGAPAREGYANLPGVRLYFLDTGGNGIPVVFTHPASSSTISWVNQIPAFKKAGYRFITYDRRGWGRTDDTPTPPHMGDSDDLQALMDYLHIDQKFHLVGSAAGGSTAFDYALSHQDHLRSLVVADSISAVQDPEYQTIIERLHTPHFADLTFDFRELGPAYRAMNPEGTKRWLEIQQASRKTPPVLQPMHNTITLKILESIHVPTLMMTGDADLYVPPPLLKFFTDHIKGSEAVIIPGAGHTGYWEQPEIFNKDVLDFIRKH